MLCAPAQPASLQPLYPQELEDPQPPPLLSGLSAPWKTFWGTFSTLGIGNAPIDLSHSSAFHPDVIELLGVLHLIPKVLEGMRFIQQERV